MKLTTQGLIVKEQTVGEKDKLVTALTADMGVIRAFVKGAKNIRSPKGAATQLLCYSQFVVYSGKNKDTLIIDEAKTLDMFAKLRRNVENMCLAQYFCELAPHLCPHGQPAEKQLKVILNGLYLLAENKRHPLLIKACVEMRLMCYAGYQPQLTMCSGCGCYESGTMYFLPKEGILTCGNCLSKEKLPWALLLGRGVTRALRHTVFAEDSKLFSFNLPAEGLMLLNSATELFMNSILERDFQTLSFYKFMAGFTVSAPAAGNPEEKSSADTG